MYACDWCLSQPTAKFWFLLNTSTGAASFASKTFQWYTVVSVTRPRVVSLNHFQNTTSSFMVVDFSFDFAPKSNICNVRDCAFNAITCLVQCMMALSALIGLRMTLLLFLRSMMMTSGDAVSFFFSRTQMNESDSTVCKLFVSFHSISRVPQ